MESNHMKLHTLCFIALGLLGLTLSPAASAVDDDFLRCTKLPNIDERHACYDELAKKAESASTEPADESASASYLTEAWKLGPKDAAPRHLADIVTYRPNYIIFRQTNDPNTRPRSPATGRTTLPGLDRNVIKIQGSFKTELVSREAFARVGATPLLRNVGIDSARLWFGYTQTMAWQAMDHGRTRPVQDTNYEPEAILTFGTSNKGDGFKLINLGLSHMSNGIDPRQHRGWSRAYVQGGWEWDRLSVLARAWRVLPESDDDNPDIRTYMGSGDLVARYRAAGGYVTSVLLRRNLGTGRGFVQVDWATPVLNAIGGLKLHAQITSGYGESLIDYNFQQTTLGIGVSFGD
jgi:phospholipase A1